MYIQNVISAVIAIMLVFSLSAQAQVEQVTRLLDAQTVTIPINPDFALNAHYYKAERSKGGALILHDCHNSIARYMSLAEQFQRQRIDAMVLDMRGFGKSISETYSHENIKKQSKDILTYQQNVALLNAYWGEDAIKAYQVLRENLGLKLPISVISFGCAAYTAVQLAEKVHVKSAVYIAPEMDFMAKERYKNLVDIPTYFAGSIHQTESFQTAKELFGWNGDGQTKIQLTKKAGPLHINSGLFADVALWVSYISGK